MANQACTITQSLPTSVSGSRFREITWTYLTDDGTGDLNVTIALPAAIAGSGALGGPTPPIANPPITGVALRCICIPDAGNPPDNLYDITILDKDGMDILHGNGANRSNAAADDCIGYVSANALVSVSLSTLALTVTAAGNANAGVVRLLLTM